MIAAAATPAHDDGHTDCYYAGLLTAALPHLIDDAMIDRAALALRNHNHAGQGHPPLSKLHEKSAFLWRDRAAAVLRAALGGDHGD